MNANSVELFEQEIAARQRRNQRRRAIKTPKDTKIL